MIKPFQAAPGRDVTKDRPSSFDIPQYYFDQRHVIAQDAPRLRALRQAVNSSADLASPQWAQWYSVALGFKPDLILELGRGRGNSTALFTQAASRIGGTSLVSLCMTSDWQDEVVPLVKKIVESSWFDPLDARRGDILTTDYEAMFKGKERVLMLWDAHGFEIAEVVLGRILPLLANREHVFILHDISDNRYSESTRSYRGLPLWKGPQWQERTGIWDTRTNIGWMSSIQNQVIALADFSARNDVEVQSADHEYREFFAARPEAANEMKAVVGDEFFSVQSHWAFFSLTGKEGPFFFPADSARPQCEHQAPAVIEKVDPPLPSGVRMPLRLSTPPTRWLYGGVIYWKMPSPSPPTGVPVWLRLKIHAQDALIGVGLLNTTGSVFLEKRLVAPAAEPGWLFLPIDDRSQVGGIAIYTYDKGEVARVEVSELSVIW